MVLARGHQVVHLLVAALREVLAAVLALGDPAGQLAEAGEGRALLGQVVVQLLPGPGDEFQVLFGPGVDPEVGEVFQ